MVVCLCAGLLTNWQPMQEVPASCPIAAEMGSSPHMILIRIKSVWKMNEQTYNRISDLHVLV